MTDGHEFFEVVGEKFATDIESANSLMDWFAFEKRCHGRMREAGVNYEQAFDW